jgi:hypothetical protein
MNRAIGVIALVIGVACANDRSGTKPSSTGSGSSSAPVADKGKQPVIPDTLAGKTFERGSTRSTAAMTRG